MQQRRRRTIAGILISLFLLGYAVYTNQQQPVPGFESVNSTQDARTSPALNVLEQLEVKGRAPKTGYSREQFGSGWADIGACDTRNLVLKRDLEPVGISDDGCTVVRGVLLDPYTAHIINFSKGQVSSALVQIDHVVALSDAWQKGAQQMDPLDRERFANDPLNLLAVDGPANRNKGDGDAATWLPPNKTYRCQYVARQIAVKKKYHLWVTKAEKDAIKRILNSCPAQSLPYENEQ